MSNRCRAVTLVCAFSLEPDAADVVLAADAVAGVHPGGDEIVGPVPGVAGVVAQKVNALSVSTVIRIRERSGQLHVLLKAFAAVGRNSGIRLIADVGGIVATVKPAH